MDQELIDRYHRGDPVATTAIRNQLRGVAARVLLSHAWQLDPGGRVELEKQAAVAAMAKRHTSPVAYAMAAMSAAAEGGIRAHRRRRGLAVDASPGPEELVAVAMETASAAQAAGLRRLLESDPEIQNQLEIARTALQAAATARVQAPEPIVEGPTTDLNQLAQQIAEEADATEESRLSGSSQERLRAEAQRRAERTRGKGGDRRPLPKLKTKEKSSLPFLPLLVAGALIGGFAWWSSRLTPEEQVWKVAAMLPKERPPVARKVKFRGRALAAVEEMERGDCANASRRLGMAAKDKPNSVYLRYYQGLAAVCAYDGPAALEALGKVKNMAPTMPWAYDWWLGQALLLDLQFEEGLIVLDRLAASKHGRSEDARRLAQDIRDEF